METTNYAITGMHCGSCSTLLEQSLQKQAGVETATVNIATHTLQISYDTKVLSLASLQKIVADLGFTLVLPA